MANENEMKIIFGADTSPLRSEVSKGADVVEDFGDKVDKTADRAARSFDKLKKSTKGIPQAFDEVAASAEALKRINKRIDEVADAALKAGKPLENFGRAPLANLADLDKQLRTIKATLNSGFKSEIGRINLSPTNFSSLARSAEQLSAANNRLRGSSTSAAFALQNIGRVAQDVPFGFIGIQNNINPLLESFQRLKIETGSTKGALKALASSIGGAGGLGLAISLASSAFLIFQNGFQSFSKKTKEATDRTKEFVDSLKSIEDVSGQAAGSVAAEIQVVRTLAGAITDTNKSYKERKNALDQLHNVNKNYFGDLTLEASSLATLTSKVNEYTQALISQAVVKGFGDEIGRVNKELFDQNKALDDAKTKLTQATLAKEKFGSLTITSATGEERLKAGAGKIENALNQASKAFQEQRDVVEKLDTNYAELSGAMEDAVQKSLKFKSVSGGDKKQKEEIDLLKQRRDVLKEIVDVQRQGLDDKDILVTDASLELKNVEIKLIQRDFKGSEEEKKKLLQQMFPDFDGTNLHYSKPIVMTASIVFKPVVDSIGPDPLGDDIGKTWEERFPEFVKKAVKDGDEARKKIAAPIQALNEDIRTAMSNAALGLAEAFGDVLSGNISPIQGFVNVISDALDQLGKALIAFGTVKLLAIEALKSLNPFVAIAAGALAIGYAKLLKAKLGKAPKFAEGAIVRGPTLGMVGEAGPEMIIPLSRANQFMDSGGSEGFVARTELRGQDILLLIERAMGSRGRRGG